MSGSELALFKASRWPPLLHCWRARAQSATAPWLLAIASQMTELAVSLLGHRPPTSACAVSQDEMFIWFICCTFCASSSMTLPISGEIVSIASLKAKPSALLAVALSIATSSAVLMNENEPAKRSMPPQPARAWGNCRLKGWMFFCGKARPDRSHRIVARRLALVGAGAGDIGLDPHVGHEALHLAFDPGRGGSGRGEQDCGAEHRAKRAARDLAETGGRRAARISSRSRA
jgi:hypothetical protein